MRGTLRNRWPGRDGDVHAGSSPRMRGTLATIAGHPTAGPHPRIIPAHAGNSPTAEPVQGRSIASGSSPRMRGTLVPGVEALGRSTSDHPRACGELTRRRCGSRAIRIIPAHAGNSHPPCKVARNGSSPRMRGTLRLRPHVASSVRGPSDHPRACGELQTGERRYCVPNLQRADHPRACGELSPIGRAPGKTGKRIIPAHAGNSVSHSTSTFRMTSDHPRACGELDRQPHGQRARTRGSSPRMRGTPSRVEVETRR